MSLNIFNDLEDLWSDVSRNMNTQIDGIKKRFRRPENLKSQEDFVQWGREYIDRMKSSKWASQMEKAKTNFFSLLRVLGVNDELLRETFMANKKEFLDPLFGEFIAVIALVLGWKNKDKEAFSQALGEIGVVGVFAAKPFVCLIALCGLAWGYERSFHPEAFKKGGLVGIGGMTAAFFAPGAFTGLLAAIVVMVYINRKISIDRPVETQVREIFQQIKKGQFVKETREAWRSFEEFLEKLFKSSEPKEEPSPPLLSN